MCVPIRISDLKASVLEQELILDGLVDSVVSLSIYNEFKIAPTIQSLCTGAIESAVDKVYLFLMSINIIPCLTFVCVGT